MRPVRRNLSRKGVIVGLSWILCVVPCLGQKATVTEAPRDLKTYPFFDPNPVPVLVKDARLYPYHRFEGYSDVGTPKAWNVVKLENDYLEVYVLPEVGGKIWGAVEKAGGQAFIYRNEVLKFRNIALRGPWTSGGIEFNFGIIGHTPATATPVDYVLQRHADGSVTCVVGTMDLPSRTHWRVAIHVPADRAYFETRVLWYNPTPLLQPYYTWMTAAAPAREDLEVSLPGNQYLAHNGDARPWPVDAAGRQLAWYRNNAFGGNKSYHVVGAYHDFFGAYYHDTDSGFGHWARYEDMPGQKLWLWALSRQGGIWEDLLTDTDGQYVEFQAGRLFVQYAPAGAVNPIRQVGFDPYATDRWREVWFPVNGLGGLNEASPQGAMYVQKTDTTLSVRLHAFERADATLEVVVAGEVIHRRPLALRPMEAVTTTLYTDAADVEVRVPELGLRYRTPDEADRLDRPFRTDPAALPAQPEADRLMAQGREYLKARQYGPAAQQFEAVLAAQPWHREALMAMADLSYRRARYDEGLDYIRKALQLDTYDAGANYLAGILYRAAGDLTNARESLGWAARAMGYRSAAYTQLAEIALQAGDDAAATHDAGRALDYDRYNLNAYEVQALVARRTGDDAAAEAAQDHLLEIDPLHHLAYFERYLLHPSEDHRRRFREMIRNEFPDQTYLELALSYHGRGLDEAAVELLKWRASESEHPLLEAWLAYLLREENPAESERYLTRATTRSPAFVFPYRRETLVVLAWAARQVPHWKWPYYLALNLWAKDRKAEAARLLQSVADQPDYGPFYVARAALLAEVLDHDEAHDLYRAVHLDSTRALLWIPLIQYEQERKRWDRAVALSARAVERFPENPGLALLHARSLYFTDRLDESIALLKSVRVLPSEFSGTGRQWYAWALLKRATQKLRDGAYRAAVADLEASLLWPENLGQGRPYEPDERLQHFMLAFCHEKLGNRRRAEDYLQRVLAYTAAHPGGGMETYLAYLAFIRRGNDAEADALLRSLAEDPAAGDPAGRWVVATVRRDAAALEALRREEPAFFETPTFQLFNDLITVARAER